MRAQLHIPDSLRWAGLDAALRGLQALDELEVASGAHPWLYESGVRYEPEPRGSERWLPVSLVRSAGVADCEDLAAWRAAELKVTGEDPEAAAQVVRTGGRTWHAVVRRADGSYEDPSAVLGMRTAGGLLAPVRFALAPELGRDYRARVELQGLGARELYDEVGACGRCALRGALEAATLGQLSSIPVIGPLLSMFTSALSPGGAAPAPAAAAPAPKVQVATPTGIYDATLPSGAEYEEGLISLARQLHSLTSREVARRGRRR